MRLDFHHTGLQFFFVTLTLAERRPALLPLGETVKATLVALHGRFPAATVSDFVIMPDHVHFLLIVDYAKDPAFNPLWATHRLMDAVEEAWKGRGRQDRAKHSLGGVRGARAPVLCIPPLRRAIAATTHFATPLREEPATESRSNRSC